MKILFFLLALVTTGVNGWGFYGNYQAQQQADQAVVNAKEAAAYFIIITQEVQQYYDKLKSLHQCTEV